MENRRLFFRPTRQPGVPLPFGLRSTGLYEVDQGWREKKSGRPFLQLFWGLEGVGEFGFQGKVLKLPPHHVCHYLPDEPHQISSLSKRWLYRWLTLDGELAVSVVRGFGLAQKPAPAGPCPGHLFDSLEKTIRQNTPFAERSCASIAFSILSEAAGGQNPGDKSRDAIALRIKSEIDRRIADPGFGIEQLADKFGLHRSMVYRRFFARFHISPVEYLGRARVQKALDLLGREFLSITDIALQCGFRDANYFTKVIHRATGQSPREFRKSIRSS
jgi:AraC-like DNA-binding protein